MEGLEVTFDELLQIYQNHITSSFEKTHGNDLLGEELSCFSFWMLHDTASKGWMTLAEVGKLLHTFKFDHLVTDEKGTSTPLTLQAFEKEFEFNLRDKQKELLHLKENDSIIRFDLVRDIFLERGL